MKFDCFNDIGEKESMKNYTSFVKYPLLFRRRSVCIATLKIKDVAVGPRFTAFFARRLRVLRSRKLCAAWGNGEILFFHDMTNEKGVR
jgi:hypothetical protein